MKRLSMTLLLCLCWAPAWTAEAPDFEAATLDGTSVRLADYRGRVVVMDFWATWCPPCREQLPRLAALEAQHDDVVVLAISVDKRRKNVERFAERFELPGTVLLDADGAIASRYGIEGMPWTVLVDRDGSIVWARGGLREEGHVQLAEDVARLLGTE